MAAVSRSPNQLDLFVTGSDGKVYTSWWSPESGWSGIDNNWRPLGGVFPAGAPAAAVSRSPNQLDLFVTGSDGKVYTSWWSPGSGWSGIDNKWRPLGGVFPAGAPVTALSRAPNQLDLFATGNDGKVYTSWWSPESGWSSIDNNWRPLGGTCPTGAPVAAVSRSPNQLDLFVTGSDGKVYTSWWSPESGWSSIENNWRPLGGVFPAGAPVTAVSRASNQLDLFVTGNDGKVYTSWWSPEFGWSGIENNWRPLGGVFPAGASVTAVSRGQNQLDLFVTGSDGKVYASRRSPGSGWSGIEDNWRPLGGMFPAGAPVAAVSRRPNQLDLFITGSDGKVYTGWWSPGSGWAGID